MKQNTNQTQTNQTNLNQNQFVVKRRAALDSYGNPVISEMGKQIFNYEVFGTLMGKPVTVQLDVVVKSIGGGKTESKAAAFELLDLVFDGSDETADIVIRPVDASFVGADGKRVERTSFALFAVEKDTGFELELPIKPRQTTDNTKLMNLIRKNEYLAQKAKESSEGAE